MFDKIGLTATPGFADRGLCTLFLGATPPLPGLYQFLPCVFFGVNPLLLWGAHLVQVRGISQPFS
jgi:hypothetical protein